VALACAPKGEPWTSQPGRNTGSHIAVQIRVTRVDDRRGRPAIWLAPRRGTAPAPEATSGSSRSAAMRMLQRSASICGPTPNRSPQCLGTLIDGVGGIGTPVAGLERKAEEPGPGASGRGRVAVTHSAGPGRVLTTRCCRSSRGLERPQLGGYRTKAIPVSRHHATSHFGALASRLGYPARGARGKIEREWS